MFSKPAVAAASTSVTKPWSVAQTSTKFKKKVNVEDCAFQWMLCVHIPASTNVLFFHRWTCYLQDSDKW